MGGLMTNEYSLAPKEQYELTKRNLVNDYLDQIHPVWKARTLIDRVKQLIPVDLSSTC